MKVIQCYNGQRPFDDVTLHVYACRSHSMRNVYVQHIYKYVCVCYVYIYIHTYDIYTRNMYIYIYIHTIHIYIYHYEYVCMYVCARIPVCPYMRIVPTANPCVTDRMTSPTLPSYTCIYMYVYLCVCMCLLMRVMHQVTCIPLVSTEIYVNISNMCMYMYMCMYMWVYIYIYIYIYIPVYMYLCMYRNMCGGLDHFFRTLPEYTSVHMYACNYVMIMSRWFIIMSR